MKKFGIDTRAVHGGEPKERVEGAVSLPIFSSSTYEYRGETQYEEVRYQRLNNTPNQMWLAQKIADLERAEEAVITGSGMAAISATLFTLIGLGEHLLSQDHLYGGTHNLLHEWYPKMGRSVSFFSDVSDLEKLLKKETKAIYVEGISNPLLEVQNLPKILLFAKTHGLLTIIDNTFLSPAGFLPVPFGFDIVLHSATKYLNGHTDVVAGSVAGRKKEVDSVRMYLGHLGGGLDSFSCFLLNRGLKTLGVRVRAQNENALKLAEALAEHPKIKRVIYPGLSSHPHHKLAKEWFQGFGGVLSFEHTDTSLSSLDERLHRLRFGVVAPSLGGVETLVTRPATTSHSSLSPEERARLGISDALVRVSVGLENSEDLIADFSEALG